MNPIIVNMDEMSDSTEVYDSRPNRFLVYTIYAVFSMIIIAVLWMSLSKMDVVVKSNGVFKGSDAIYEISCGVTGSVKETCIENGQYVNEGDVLYILNVEELSDTILKYQTELEAAQDRLDILGAYAKSLDGDSAELESLTDNPYYPEFINRRDLLYANVDLEGSNPSGQISLYQGSIDSINDTILKYSEKIVKLNYVKQCIVTRTNIFDPSDSFYYSMVNSYIASYDFTVKQYDNQINEYQRQIDSYQRQINEYEKQLNSSGMMRSSGSTYNGGNESVNTSDDTSASSDTASSTGDASDTTTAGSADSAPTPAADGSSYNTVSGNSTAVVGVSGTNQSSYTNDGLTSLVVQRDALVDSRNSLSEEKAQALKNLELQQIATIENTISGYNETILSLESNRTSAELQLNSVNVVDQEARETVAILAEKGNIAAEMLSYEDRLNECENYLKSYDIKNNNCIIKACASGYFYYTQELMTGSYIQAGTTIGNIYPENESRYYAEIFVENSDIAQIQVGQNVKFEIAAYPSSEYGYFVGTVENISKDISVNQATGQAYYIVRVSCDNMSVVGKDGKEATLMNGMACQAKIVVDEEIILRLLLEEIDLLD
jgi:multidrug resistance efflux pump